MLESIPSVHNKICLTPTVDALEKLYSMFLWIAKKDSERFCGELLKNYFKSQSILICFIDLFTDLGGTNQYQTNFESRSVHKNGFTERIVQYKY